MNYCVLFFALTGPCLTSSTNTTSDPVSSLRAQVQVFLREVSTLTNASAELSESDRLSKSPLRTLSTTLERRMDQQFAVLRQNILRRLNALQRTPKQTANTTLSGKQLCPRPWIQVRPDLCMSVSVGKATWHQAGKVCSLHGGSLATFRDANEYKDTLSSLGPVIYFCPWIGIQWKQRFRVGNAYGKRPSLFTIRGPPPGTHCVVACWDKMIRQTCALKKHFYCKKNIV